MYVLKPTKTFRFTYSLKGFDGSIWNEVFFVSLYETVFSFKKKKKKRKMVQFEIESFKEINLVGF